MGQDRRVLRRNLLLETPDGSLRVAEITGKPPEYPKTKALIKRN